MKHLKWSRLVCAIGAFLALAISAGSVAAQGVTTAGITGVVKDAQGAVIPGVTVTALAFQTILSSFFVSVLGMRRW